LSRLAQFTESKAFAKSSLITRVGARRLWLHWTSSLARMKFLTMDLPLMKSI
jgi:hypothetical protein